MSETTINAPVKEASQFKMLRAMVGIGIICAFLIVLTFEGTLPRIEALKAEVLEKAIFKVLPGVTKTQTFVLDESNSFHVLNEDENITGEVVYAGYDANNKLIGIALEGRGMGYADIISVLYGFDPFEEKVVGFYVLESKETPGLGDRIEKDAAFLANFESLDVSLTDDKKQVRNRIVPVKNGDKESPWEVDCITGATISSRAIGNLLGESTSYWAPLVVQQLETFQQEANNNHPENE